MVPVTALRILLFRVPCKTPVRTSFGLMRDRPALLVQVIDRDGFHGWGEVWCNFPACGAEHRAKLLETIIAPLVLGKKFFDPRAVWFELVHKTRILSLQTGEHGPLSQVLAGVDLALWDLAARRQGLPLHHYLKLSESDRLESPPPFIHLPVYASGINPDVVEDEILRTRKLGFRAFKFKVGFGESVDLRNLDSALALLNPGERLAVDANQIWDPGQALEMASKIAARCVAHQQDLLWLEEPVSADHPWSVWEELGRSPSIPLAAGENLRGPEAFDEAIHRSVLSVIQPDLCKWGGFSGCLPVALAARQADKCYCPHYLGGGIGLLASAHLLAAVGGGGLLEVDVNENPLRELLAEPFPVVRDGEMILSSESGLGVEPGWKAAGFVPVVDLLLQ